MISSALIFWGIGIAIGLFIIGMCMIEGIALEDAPKFVAFAVFWPFALLITAMIGLQHIRGGNDSDGLSRKQRRKINYERLLNDELERNIRIIKGK